MKSVVVGGVVAGVVMVSLLAAGCSGDAEPEGDGSPSGSASSQPAQTPSSTPSSASSAPSSASAEPVLLRARPARTKADWALLRAARVASVRGVERALARGAAIDAFDETGATALILATSAREVELATRLAELGADVNHKDNGQESPYLISTSEIGDDPRLLEVFLAHGGDLESHDSFDGTGLIRAADRGYVRIVRRLLATDVALDHVNNLGWTALLEAVLLGDGDVAHQRVVRLLLDAGVDRTVPDSRGVTALEHARRLGYAEMVRLLEQ
ncbi:MAG: ankyrin repeat domain-containing protein [Nocardioides sp.]